MNLTEECLTCEYSNACKGLIEEIEIRSDGTCETRDYLKEVLEEGES